VEAEGWYHDPYGLHEERWYSDGTPTKLVRDAHVESYDPPPASPPPTAELVRSAAHPSSSGSGDLRRADDAERGDGQGEPNYSERALDSMWPTPGAPPPPRR
jgi:hypothetical protein